LRQTKKPHEPRIAGFLIVSGWNPDGDGAGLPATAAAATTAVTATAATTTATSAAFTGTGFVDWPGAALELLAGEFVDGLAGTVVIHGDEGEPTGATGLTVRDDSDFLDLAIGSKKGLKCIFGGVEGHVANVELHDLNSENM
jgi:hypothetical protein